MSFDPIARALYSEMFGGAPDDAGNKLRQRLEQTNSALDKFFDNLETQMLDEEPELVTKAAPYFTPDDVVRDLDRLRNWDKHLDWDVWFASDAADCPAEGGGYYKRLSNGQLQKVHRF